MNKLLILHADHEQKLFCKYSEVSGFISLQIYILLFLQVLLLLWGPLHGGANQKVIEMLENIKNDGGDLQKWINKAKDKK